MKLLITLLISSLFLFTGCIAKKMAVSNAEALIEQRIRDRLNLYPKQRKDLSKDVSLFLNQQKPQIEKGLPILIGLSPETAGLDEKYQQLSSVAEGVVQNFMALVAKYLVKLDPTQQKDLFAYLDKENHKIEKRGKAELRNKYQKYVDYLLGSVTKEQKEILKKMEPDFDKAREQSLKRRKELFAKMKDIYASQETFLVKEKQLTQLFKENQKASFESAQILNLMKNIIPTITPDQKKAYTNRLKETKDLIQHYLKTKY